MNLRRRPAFTILESLIAMSILAIASILSVQLGATALTERARLADEMALLEMANNTLETAGTLNFEVLTPEWAAGQTLPARWQERIPGLTMAVRLESVADNKRAKRISVRIDRDGKSEERVRIVDLTSIIVDRGSKEARP